ncbi:MAG: hypothetical protein KIT84_17320 [Labilithrix sp.]|nr:hypothetical protein [Labilithrix sp.]MCW5812792.1 hypothetical protein [Labilithrix sp.]
MVRRLFPALLFPAVLLLAACSSKSKAEGARDAEADAATTVTVAVVDAGPPPAEAKAAETKPDAPPDDVTAYVRAHLPKGGSVLAGDPPKITHEVQPGDHAQSLANAYLELTEVYRVEELTALLAKKRLAPGSTIEIPSPIRAVPRDPKEERLGWPEDKVLKGVFVTGAWASIKWADTVDKVADHGLNAIVLDGKDYDGYVNYPSKAKIAVESGAIRATNIPNLVRAVRYAHWHGVRVIFRIPCFHDPWADKHLPDSRLSIRYTPTGKPIHIDWIDPTLPEAQDYAIEIAKEGIEAGVDEVQLDYVRFPVHVTQKVAVLPDPSERSKIMRDFVKRVAAVTHADGVKLSLDFFGVTATGIQEDIDKLGQDIPTVAPEADAISLMSYPSHYGKGYLGFSNPADHVEIIGIGNRAALEKLKPTGAKTIFRTWLQAFPQGVTRYDSAYLLGQAKSAETSGGVGWLMWSPGCQYDQVWMGWPSIKAKK